MSSLVPPPPGVSAAEWQARIDLAAAYRLVARRGWDDLIYTHVSVRHPEIENAFLINRFGLRFAEVTASNLLVIDGDGKVLGDQPYRANPAGFAIHAAVHRARADANCVMHLHTDVGIAVSMLECGLLLVSQHADRKSTRLNSSHVRISYAVLCLKKKISKKANIHPNVSSELVHGLGADYLKASRF